MTFDRVGTKRLNHLQLRDQPVTLRSLQSGSASVDSRLQAIWVLAAYLMLRRGE